MRAIRAFVAVAVPEALQHRVAAEAQALGSPADRIRWVHPPRLHLTLHFLGAVAEERIPRVTKALLAASRGMEPFEARLEGMAAFPPRGSPRVVWIGLGDPAPLLFLQGRVEEHLAAAGFPREGRTWRPHVTCGRVQAARDPLALRQALEARCGRIWGTFEVAGVDLMESVLGRGGARYVQLASAPLGR